MTMGNSFLPPMKIGVELEVLDGRRALSHIGDDRNNWHAGSDGSLSSYSEGTEYKFARPLHSKQAIDSITSLCRAMRISNARADSSCGFHLHLDFNNWSYDGVRRFVTIASAFYPKLSKIVASTRVRQGGYCSSRSYDDFVADLNRATDLTQLGRTQGSRYYWMNLASLVRHHSIEIRMHHGTVRSDEVLTWADFWTKLAFFVAENKSYQYSSRRGFCQETLDMLPLHPLTVVRFGSNSPSWTGYRD